MIPFALDLSLFPKQVGYWPEREGKAGLPFWRGGVMGGEVGGVISSFENRFLKIKLVLGHLGGSVG